MIWIDVCDTGAIPLRGARVLRLGAIDVAVFRTGEGRIYALRDRCPHRGGPLSQGLVHGDRVTCPLHDWVIDLRSGAAAAPDEGCTETYAVRVDGGRVQIRVPEPGTETEGERSSERECAAADSPDRGPEREAERAPAPEPELRGES